jgi:outer membrane translocation and assembly module TamA
VEIVVEEGPPVLVRRLDFHGMEELPLAIAEEAQAAVRREVGLGMRFEEARFQKAAEQLVRVLMDHGYAYARARRSAAVDLPKDRVSLAFRVTPGNKARFGEVTIHGLDGIPEGPVRRALAITPGDPFSRTELDDARQAVLELGVFSNVAVEPDLPEERETPDGTPEPGKAAAQPDRVPIRVEVAVTKLHTVTLGGGVQADALRTDLHLTAGWESRNFLGGFRWFRIEALPGVVLYPTRMPVL